MGINFSDLSRPDEFVENLVFSRKEHENKIETVTILSPYSHNVKPFYINYLKISDEEPDIHKTSVPKSAIYITHFDEGISSRRSSLFLYGIDHKNIWLWLEPTRACMDLIDEGLILIPDERKRTVIDDLTTKFGGLILRMQVSKEAYNKEYGHCIG